MRRGEPDRQSRDDQAKKGSLIGAAGGANNSICAICWVTHYAERSLNATLIDTAAMTTPYKIK
jgi:hypothetical protein